MNFLPLLTWGAGKLGEFARNKIEDKIEGIPKSPIGTEAGQDQYAYDEARFPGTTPWERTGSPATMSQVDVANQQRKQERTLQTRELKNRKEIADITARSSIISAATPFGIPGIESALKVYRGNPPADYPTNISMGMQKLKPEIDKLESETGVNIEDAAVKVLEGKNLKSQGDILRAKAEFAREAAALDLEGEYWKTATDIFNSLLLNIGGGLFAWFKLKPKGDSGFQGFGTGQKPDEPIFPGFRKKKNVEIDVKQGY